MREARTPGTPPPKAALGAGVLTGLVSGAVAIAASQLIAGILNPQASPVITVGQASIDATPEWLKSFAIRTFGSNDKRVLLLGIGFVLGLVSIALGMASVRRLRVGLIGLAAFGAVGVAAALTRPTARLPDVLPAVAGAVAGALALVQLHRSFGDAKPRSSAEGASATPVSIDRRRFLVTSGWGAAMALTAGGAGRFLAKRFEATASRADVRIPVPRSLASATPRSAELSVPGLSPFYTPNTSFYRVDTALLVPSVRAETWRLRIHGMVDREITIDYPQLLSRGLIERDITLNCVSNEVGGHYIGNARWVGAPLRDLLQEAGVREGASQLVSTSIDGFTIGTPTAAVMDGRDAMLAVSMNGEPLPLAHGFPVRMLVPGLYGYVSATKWVTDMELTTFDAFDAYWVKRGWAQQGPVKTESRIDTPKAFDHLRAGQVAVAGVAWAQHTGIHGVQVQIDDGAWNDAELSALDTIDTWRQWVYRWDAVPGSHTLRVRASDQTGYTQTPVHMHPFPSGATGQHMIDVQVT